MQHPRLSIVIPTKNEGNYIGQTLAQFLVYLEKYDLEIIVSDAHSSDQTVAIVQGYATETAGRIRLVQNTGKQNIAIGRNFGAAHTQGGIAYLHRICAHHSPRRFREYGYTQVSWIYLREGLSLLFRGKSYAEERTPVR